MDNISLFLGVILLLFGIKKLNTPRYGESFVGTFKFRTWLFKKNFRRKDRN